MIGSLPDREIIVVCTGGIAREIGYMVNHHILTPTASEITLVDKAPIKIPVKARVDLEYKPVKKYPKPKSKYHN